MNEKMYFSNKMERRGLMFGFLGVVFFSLARVKGDSRPLILRDFIVVNGWVLPLRMFNDLRL